MFLKITIRVHDRTGARDIWFAFQTLGGEESLSDVRQVLADFGSLHGVRYDTQEGDGAPGREILNEREIVLMEGTVASIEPLDFPLRWRDGRRAFQPGVPG